MGSSSREISGAGIAPGFLVAAPNLVGLPFERSVVLISETSDSGAMGFILNQPSDITLGRIAEDMRLTIAEEHRDCAVWIGGPVRTDQGWLVIDLPKGSDEPIGTFTRLPGGYVVAASMEALQDLLTSSEARFRLFLGYSGWGTGQLETELSEGSWIPMSYEPELILEPEPTTLWSKSLNALGLPDATLWSRGGGSA